MNQTHTIDLPPEWASNPWIQECLSRMERFSNDPLKVEEYEEAEKALLIYTKTQNGNTVQVWPKVWRSVENKECNKGFSREENKESNKDLWKANQLQRDHEET